MRITLNNEPFELNESPEIKQTPCTVKRLLALKNWTFPLIIVKINGALIQRDQWDLTIVFDGDIVEAIHLVSGG